MKDEALDPFRSVHPGEGRDPFRPWAPACAGVIGERAFMVVLSSMTGPWGARRR